MANIYLNAPGDTDRLDLSTALTGKVTARDGAGKFTVTKGDLTFTFSGSGFSGTDASGWPTKGLISFIVVTGPGGASRYTLSLEGTFAVADFKALLAKPQDQVAAALFAGDDFISGSVGDDILKGRDGDDAIFGEGGKDTLDGGEGDDFLYVESAGATVIGGAGQDRVSLDFRRSQAAIEVSLGAASAVTTYKVDGVAAGTLTGVELLGFDGGAGADRITGGANADILTGNDGDDRLSGGAGSDYLDGGAGKNVLNGGTGDDFLTLQAGRDVTDFIGGDGSDTLIVSASGAVNVVIDISDPTKTAAMTADGKAAGSVIGVERIVARTGDGDDKVTGGAGDDEIDLGRGVNVMRGGAGADLLTSRNAADTIDGGSGTDRANLYFGGTQSIVFDISSAATVARITVGGKAAGTIAGVEAINFEGSSAGDRVTSGIGDDYLRSGAGNDVLDAGAGEDTLAFSFGASVGVTVDLAAGTASRAGLDTDIVRNFENVNGTSKDDVLKGDGGANRLDGGFGGRDQLFGFGGDDILVSGTADGATFDGGTGDDLAVLDFYQAQGGLTLSLGATGAGSFTIAGGRTGTLKDIERLIVYGTLQGDRITGGVGEDTIYNGGGDDVLDGGGGTDTLRYISDYASGPPVGRVIVDLAAGVSKRFRPDFNTGGEKAFDVDTIRNFENVIGSELSDEIRGDARDNVLDGGFGMASGGNAADVLIGRKGNDTYVVDSLLDRVVELAGEGDDLILSSVDWSLAGIYVERLTLTGEAIKATGNSFANTITGNDLANVIDGGRGDDVMIGGKGSDTYVVDSTGDRVVERNIEGNDHVMSSVNFNMGGSYLERLTLTGTAKYGTGNSLDNTITGNASNNVLSGGTGADTLTGGKGHDRYIVDNVKDRVVEKADEGSDLIVSSVTYSLAGTYVERLELSGTAALNATGNSLDNTLTGNGGDNRLEGGGGADTLIGGAGKDTYVYRALSDSTVARSDTITELGFGDRLDLSLIDANTALAGNQAFALVDAFSGARGQATLTYDAATKFSTLLLDLDGDRTADMRILIGGDANEARIVF